MSMKKSNTKKIVLSAALLSVVAIGAGAATTGFAAVSADGRIGADKAKQLAAQAAGGQAYSAELEKERGIVYYDVDVRKDRKEYDVHIDAYTGKTLKMERDDRDDDDWDDNDWDDDRRISGGTPSASPSASASPSIFPSPSAGKPDISREQAARIAAERVDGTVIRSKLDKDDGVLHYEIELKTKRGEAEVDVHAHTGKILSVDYDDDDYDDDDDDLYDD
jgi:uncharacterized membrane protein YkoI